MGHFAWQNLLTRPLRTFLALVGLSVPILGVLGLFSVSDGLRNMVGNTLDKIKGVMVLRENVPTPVFSHLPASVGQRLWAIPGVKAVAPEVWGLPPTIENVSLIPKNPPGVLDEDQGEDDPELPGRDRDPGAGHRRAQAAQERGVPERDEGRAVPPGLRPGVAEHRHQPEDRPRAPRTPKGRIPSRSASQLKIGSDAFTIVGIYETGSFLLDPVIVMDIATARKVVGEADDTVSSFYVEADDPGIIDEIAKRIEDTITDPRLDARSMSEFAANFGTVMSQLDTFLLMTVSLALVVGVVGIINTMLMSTTERFVEFGVLRTNGWSRGNVLSLVTIESAYLGLMSGVVGCLMAFALTQVANQFISGGLSLQFTPRLIGIGLALSVVMGTLGGLYPAWKASRLVPMDAIRLGSH